MIPIDITGRNFELDDKITKYVNTKFGSLDKYVRKHSSGAKGSVILEIDKSNREDNECVCDVTIEIRGQKLHAKEATLNMYAAIDICEAKLKTQVLKYKDKNLASKQRGSKFIAKLWSRSRAATEAPEPAEEATP